MRSLVPEEGSSLSMSGNTVDEALVMRRILERDLVSGAPPLLFMAAGGYRCTQAHLCASRN